MSTPKFFIISGTSGSGKTIALQVLEDLGFYCIDNLPISLVPEMAARVLGNNTKDHNCAFSIDSRNQDIVEDIEASFASLKSYNIETRVIFVDADDKTLLKRYSETRRKHPLSDENTSLSEAIRKERSLLEYLRKIANRTIDTSSTTPHELRKLIRDETAIASDKALTLLVQSFGFKYGGPVDADFVFDVRCLPNPHWHSELKPLTGLDAPVADFLGRQDLCHNMFKDISGFIDTWLPHFINENRNYITLGIGCTGGQHRSVYLTERLREHFSRNQRIHTLARHREISL
ncbi:MAG: RNase adapter RapZ [Gammaproteobacteria bacterium]|nr:RNase adapter RapZ [Gammaproteobacteria bacterium]